MKFNKLGKTDIDVSEICLGTMTWGSQNSEAEAHEQLDYAVGEGVNFIDTAEMYPTTPRLAETTGRTEEYLGTWLKGRADRDKLVVALRGASEEMLDLVLRNMSIRAAADLADEIDVLGPKPKAVVQAARDEILAVVLQLKEEGVVTLALGGGNDMM